MRWNDLGRQAEPMLACKHACGAVYYCKGWRQRHERSCGGLAIRHAEWTLLRSADLEVGQFGFLVTEREQRDAVVSSSACGVHPNCGAICTSRTVETEEQEHASAANRLLLGPPQAAGEPDLPFGSEDSAVYSEEPSASEGVHVI